MNPSKDSCGNLHWNRIINTRRIRLYENSLFILTVPLESEEQLYLCNTAVFWLKHHSKYPSPSQKTSSDWTKNLFVKGCSVITAAFLCENYTQLPANNCKSDITYFMKLWQHYIGFDKICQYHHYEKKPYIVWLFWGCDKILLW